MLSTVEENELPENEWIVVFYPQTCALRLHPTLDAAKQHISRHAWPLYIFKSPRDFQLRFDHFQLEKFWRGINENVTWRPSSHALGPFLPEDATPPDLPTEQFCKELWQYMQRVGDRVVRLFITKTKSKEHYELKLDKMKALIADTEVFKKTYPKQARLILEALSNQPSPYMLEADIEKLMNFLVAQGKIKTKQPAWRLMQFYRPQFIKDGYILRGQEDTYEEDEDDLAA